MYVLKFNEASLSPRIKLPHERMLKITIQNFKSDSLFETLEKLLNDICSKHEITVVQSGSRRQKVDVDFNQELHNFWILFC